jgi:anti-anti-sigma factor
MQDRNISTFASSTISVSGSDRTATIEVAGELDIVSSPALERALEHALLAGRSVRLDLSRVDFIDVTGAEIILRASARGRVAIAGSVPAELTRVLTLLETSGQLLSSDGHA